MDTWAGRIARRLAWPALITAVLAVVAGVGVVPTRTYLDRKHEVALAEAKLATLTEANDRARAEADKLRTDPEIERLAREDYGLVKRGEEAYKIVPPPEEPVQIPNVWPFNQLRRQLG